MTVKTKPEIEEGAASAPAARRGKLTVYVAAAPGAGKTYAMLEEGHRLKAEGKDVVIGLVEAYGRPKTIALMQDVEAVPRQRVLFKGIEVEEMDLDAILARHPDVVLIDEIYHNNAPGLRNETRYEDIEEARNAGIDVLTTMNIQHLSSLKDIAEEIAGMRIRETVPDHILEDADQVQLVDISPEALRKRMKHGNIYPSANIERALEGFFRPGNLAALRELALRWLASEEAGRVDEAEGLPTENVVAAVRDPNQFQPVVRRALRMSKRYRGDCTVITVLRPGEPLTEEIEEAQKLCGSLDVSFELLYDAEPARAIIEAVRIHHAAQLIIGAPGGGIMDRVRGSFVDELLRELPHVDIHIIAPVSKSTGDDKKVDATVEPGSSEALPRADPVGTEGGERGYLRIYIGYAPGSGATATMLREGQRRAGRGTKVVVGAAATYGIPSNEQALEGLAVIPSRVAPDRPGWPCDMDLDAVMASGAQVVCVDDLGYVNQRPGSSKYRFEEVEGLRHAGFKVVATVDLHDVVSVADKVQTITGKQREATVPDSVLKEATELEVVGDPPAVLLERLHHVQTTLPENRQAELRRVYTLPVLTRLHEMALRLVADHTDARLLSYMEERGIKTPWETTSRVMACVAPIPGLEPLIERAAQEARRAEGSLFVVSVRGDEGGKGKEDEPAIVAAQLALANKLGGQYVILRSNKPAHALLDYAEKNHITEIVLARGEHAKQNPFADSIKRELIRAASQIDVHVLREFQPEPAVTATGAEPTAEIPSDQR
jgi:two-component system sensor histidine kinase KdpD